MTRTPPTSGAASPGSAPEAPNSCGSSFSAAVGRSAPSCARLLQRRKHRIDGASAPGTRSCRPRCRHELDCSRTLVRGDQCCGLYRRRPRRARGGPCLRGQCRGSIPTGRRDRPARSAARSHFDGLCVRRQEGRPLCRSDPPAPLNAYGRSKRAGERAVSTGNPRHVILRTSWVYSPYGKNFVKTILRLAGERDRLTVVDDQHGCPTAARDIARACLAIAQRCANEPEGAPYGVYHFAGAGEATWCELARAIIALAADRLPRVAGGRADPHRRLSDARDTRGRYEARLRGDCARLRARAAAVAGALAETIDRLLTNGDLVMKGIILAGGSGTRLYPATLAINKQLLPVYDKPMVYYPLVGADAGGHPRYPPDLDARAPAVLPALARRRMRSGASGSSYIVQEQPIGLAHAFVLGREFVGDDRVALDPWRQHLLRPWLERRTRRRRSATGWRHGICLLRQRAQPIRRSEVRR